MSKDIQVGLIMDWRYRKSRIDLQKCRQMAKNKFPNSELVEENGQLVVINATQEIKLKIEESGIFFISRKINRESIEPEVLYELFLKAVYVARALSLEFPGLLYSEDVCFYFNTKITTSFYEETKSCVIRFAEYVFEVFNVEELSRYDDHLTLVIRPSMCGITTTHLESNSSLFKI